MLHCHFRFDVHNKLWVKNFRMVISGCSEQKEASVSVDLTCAGDLCGSGPVSALPRGNVFYSLISKACAFKKLNETSFRNEDGIINRLAIRISSPEY